MNIKPIKVVLGSQFNKPVNNPTVIYKSEAPSLNNIDLIKSAPVSDLKAYYENPIKLYEATSYKEKPTALSFNILYQMSTKNSVVCAVINTRVNQVATFTKPARFSDDGVGYRIRLRDPKQIPTKEQQDIMNSLELFLERCGFSQDSERDDFDTFIRKIVRDSLTYDQACFEIVYDRKGKPGEFVAVDASTIRAASDDFDIQNSPYLTEEPKKNEEVKFVQVIDGTMTAWFTAREMAFGVRNPRTNIGIQPYGYSELEQLVNQITSHLYAEEYNSKFFSQGGTTKGIINIKGDPNGIGNKEQLESFKRQWRAQVNGMSGAWKTPVLQVPDGVEYINVSQSNREMEFEKWMNYLINIVCAIYQIDPAEVNFANNGGVGGGQSGIFESNNESKLKNSKDKGLKPLLRFVESLINKNILSHFSSDYVFCFTGMDEKSEEEKAELDSKQVRVWKTVNEIRQEHGFEPLENADIILDASFLNYIQQKDMANSMGGQSPDMGEDYESYYDESVEENPDNEELTPPENETKNLDEENIESSDEGYYENESIEKSLTKLIIRGKRG